ncbi:hypothetical protein HDV00_007423 [Rhizophlyctis rosea]|nr:hypothetical protein HDV00_007423 [Rhizophlyctis rosea]
MTSAYYGDDKVGALIFLALVVHNCAEGVAIALPTYLGTRSKPRAFTYASLLGGLPQPLGALLGYLLTTPLPSPPPSSPSSPPPYPTLFGPLFAIVSGMMLWIAIDGMVPAAWSVVGVGVQPGVGKEEGDRHAGKKIVSLGVVVGVVGMGVCKGLVGE